jgi:hypothetical protein
MGLPGKPKGFDGGEVERYYREGKIKEIADYCETDVVGTYQLWLRYELLCGGRPPGVGPKFADDGTAEPSVDYRFYDLNRCHPLTYEVLSG